jgi:hypothetical protein
LDIEMLAHSGLNQEVEIPKKRTMSQPKTLPQIHFFHSKIDEMAEIGWCVLPAIAFFLREAEQNLPRFEISQVGRLWLVFGQTLQ